MYVVSTRIDGLDETDVLMYIKGGEQQKRG